MNALYRQLKHYRSHVVVFFTMVICVLWQLNESGISAVLKHRLEALVYDSKLRLLPPWPGSSANIQIVAIDEKSLQEVGRMPWDRDRFAQLVNALSEAGAAVIVFDVLFAEPQANPVADVLDSLTGEISGGEARIRQLSYPYDYDRQFADAIKNKDVVLATQLLHSPLRKNAFPSVIQRTVAGDEGVFSFIPEFSGFVSPTPVLVDAATGQGFMNSLPDEDGSIRRTPLLLRIDNGLVPSLALEAYRVYSLIDDITPLWHESSGVRLIEGINIGHRYVHTDKYGQMLVPYQGPTGVQTLASPSAPSGPYPYTSASTILNGKVNASQFDQSIVFVGATATGLGDLQVTPVGINYPGVEVHATVFDALMSEHALPYKPDWEDGAVALLLLVFGLLVIIILPRLGSWLTIAVSAALILSTLLLSALLWSYAYLDVAVIPILFFSLVVTTYFIARGFISESATRTRIKFMFDQYVPPAHIDKMLAEPEAVSLRGERKELTVLFSDIRSFTSISEELSAQQLKDWLNQYFSPITEAILANGGTIDKYVGDMVMAFWGAPLEDKHHARHAIDGAFAMLDAIEALNEQFFKARQPYVEVGIGINSGEMNVGDMGSNFRRAYTVLGDAVNLGSRLESLTKFYGVSILLGEATAALAPEYDYLIVDKVKVKGKTQPVNIYAPVPPSRQAALKPVTEKYNATMQRYFDREFGPARAAILEIKLDGRFPYPDLLPLVTKRCHLFATNPPPRDWDGSYTHTQK